MTIYAIFAKDPENIREGWDALKGYEPPEKQPLMQGNGSGIVLTLPCCREPMVIDGPDDVPEKPVECPHGNFFVGYEES